MPETITQLSFEVPLHYLREFDEDQDFYFTLSFLFKDPCYWDTIQRLVNKRMVWVDNSTNEVRTPDDVNHLATLYRQIRPTRIIAPDHPDWGPETILTNALALAKKHVPKGRIVVITHHPDWIGHFFSYGISNFAVPYDFRYCTRDKLKRFGGCHFLGLLSVEELLIARPKTCDTSMPIKLALQGLTLREWIKAGCPHIHSTPNFFHLKMTRRQVRLAKQNIRHLKQALVSEDPVNHPRHYTQGSIEVLDFILDQKLPYLAGQVIKYVCRYRHKGGVIDLRKAEFYLRRLIREYETHNSF